MAICIGCHVPSAKCLSPKTSGRNSNASLPGLPAVSVESGLAGSSSNAMAVPPSSRAARNLRSTDRWFPTGKSGSEKAVSPDWRKPNAEAANLASVKKPKRKSLPARRLRLQGTPNGPPAKWRGPKGSVMNGTHLVHKCLTINCLYIAFTTC
jgi:hypothetical protein